MTSIDLYWLIVTLAGRIWLILAEYYFHWQNMIYTGLLSLLLAEYAASQKCSAILLCSAGSIYLWQSFLICHRPDLTVYFRLYKWQIAHFASAVSRCMRDSAVVLLCEECMKRDTVVCPQCFCLDDVIVMEVGPHDATVVICVQTAIICDRLAGFILLANRNTQSLHFCHCDANIFCSQLQAVLQVAVLN